MKLSKKRPSNLPVHFTLLVVLLGIGANQNLSSYATVEIANRENIQSVESGKDTTLQLKFTTAVRSILEDSKGNYWFGSWREGVCRFDGEQFTYFTEEDGLSDNQVRTIQEDRQGNIWFATGRGISSYDGEKIIIQASADELTAIHKLESEWQKGPGDLWFNLEIEGNGRVAKGLGRYHNQELSYLAFPAQVLDRGICRQNATITGISRGKDDRLWFANYAGVFGYDGNSFTILKESKYQYHVRSVFEDSKGRLWIGNNGIGVLLYDGKSTINFSDKHGVSNPDYLITQRVSDRPGTLARIFSIGEDRSGNIWFGTVDAGLWKYDGQTVTNYTTADGLTSMSVMEIYKDKKDILWFGMGDGSVCQFNGKSFDKIY